ncbi:avidin-like [Alligator mississippiensis]|uniref:avidin-like n=1 Tax=Alligator mississippiensis TaxID=8496 RepID=UPI002877746E|nr:avidin-like [Alligator mississippiensis]
MQRSQAQVPAAETHQTHQQLQLPAMMQSIGFIMVLVLAGVTLGIPLNYKCSLLGLWQNDLGSEMNISAGNNAGKFFGTYLTKVSATHKPIAVSPLRGSQQMGNVKQPMFGFTVTWSFTDSTTVFVGQCFVDDKGKETLQTMWLLRKKVDSIEDNWQATLVGTNNFTRLQS